MEVRKSVSICLTLLVITLVSGVWTQSQDSDNCGEGRTCFECIEAGPTCGWCAQENLPIFATRNRCDSVSSLLSDGCDRTYIADRNNRLCSLCSAQGTTSTRGLLGENENSQRCSGRGTYECGACTCNEGYYGHHCECDGRDVSREDSVAACRKSNGAYLCEGHGQCICGMCQCNPVIARDPTRTYSGKYCECNDYSCDFFNKQICGGPERGRCSCGKCQCSYGYSGTNCDCEDNNDKCLASNGLLCNNRGTCRCGVCKCDPSTNFYGPTCEDCPTCPGKCHQMKDCVLCVAFGTGPMKDEMETCLATCGDVLVADDLRGEVEDVENWKQCTVRDEADNCDAYFSYNYNPNVKTIRVQKYKPCFVLDVVAVNVTAKSGTSVNFFSTNLTVLILVICCIINTTIQM